MSTRVNRGEQLDRNWGTSFVEALGYMARNQATDLRLLLAERPERALDYLSKLVPHGFDDLSSSTMEGRRKVRDQEEALATLEAFLPLLPEATRTSVCQRALSRMVVLPGLSTLPFVERLVVEGVDVHAAEPTNGQISPFMACVSGRSVPLAEAMLARYGARPNQLDALGWSALDWAAANGHLATVRHLVQSGWRLDRPGLDERTALDRLALHTNEEQRAELIALQRAAALSRRLPAPEPRSRRRRS